MLKYIIAIVLCSCFTACAANPPAVKLPKGQCIINEDCPQGKRCLEERCRDIYFPELDRMR